MQQQLDALPADTPFLMLNALWFKPEGAALYQGYLQAAAPIVRRYGARAQTICEPQSPLLGDFDADLVFFVEWPSVDAFRGMLGDDDYRAIMHLREDAIVKSLLVPCLPIGGQRAP